MIVTWSQGPADAHMPEVILIELAAIIHRHPWWQARARLILALLEQLGVRPPAKVLDAGCGWGVTLDALAERGYQAAGMDVSRQVLEQLDRPGRTLIEADLAQPLPDQPETFDAVLALDVIEHLDDDRSAVARLGRLVRPGGCVIVSVPALPDLFGEFDAIQGHRRRYLPETLRAAFAGTGLVVERTLWWGALLIPLLKYQRRRPKSRGDEPAVEVYRRYLGLPPWPLSWLLTMIFALEHGRTLKGQWRTGASLLAVGRRKAGGR